MKCLNVGMSISWWISYGLMRNNLTWCEPWKNGLEQQRCNDQPDPREAHLSLKLLDYHSLAWKIKMFSCIITKLFTTWIFLLECYDEFFFACFLKRVTFQVTVFFVCCGIFTKLLYAKIKLLFCTMTWSQLFISNPK